MSDIVIFESDMQQIEMQLEGDPVKLTQQQMV